MDLALNNLQRLICHKTIQHTNLPLSASPKSVAGSIQAFIAINKSSVLVVKKLTSLIV